MRMFALLGFCFLLNAFAAADFAPPQSPRYGNMRDIMLAYMEPGHWQKADFMPYVAFLDKKKGGIPLDWFYDAWLFLMFGGAPSGGDYIHGTAKFSDWQFYVEQLFHPDCNLAALEHCIADVSHPLKDPSHICRVIIMIPYWGRQTKDFGDVDGDGQPENPQRDYDRFKACKWAVDTILTEWRKRSWRHLLLDGFYWMNEGIGAEDEAVVRATADYIHTQGYNFHWIPWFCAPGHDKWRELGFDLAIMQPNYAFMNVPVGAIVADEERLTQAAHIARQMGMGVEMELDYATDKDPAQQLELQLYLNHGVPELDGYMLQCARAYYQSYDTIARLYKSDNPFCQQLYEDLYRFHKGTYRRRPVSLGEGALCRLNGKTMRQLTDGLWLTQARHQERIVAAALPARIDLDLGSEQIVGDVRVHLSLPANGLLRPPDEIYVRTSRDGRNYSEGAAVGCPPLHSLGAFRTGFVLALFEPRLARYVRVELRGPTGAHTGVDEIVLYPTFHPLWGLSGKATGKISPDSAPASATVLTDGRAARVPAAGQYVRFIQGRGAVEFSLDESWILAKALAHYSLLSPGANPSFPASRTRPSCRVYAGEDVQHLSASNVISALNVQEGWLEVPLPPAEARLVRFELQGGPNVVWDELQVQRAPNLALGKPYALQPSFPAQYPDTDNKELTDGVLTEKGFGDGKTVGWTSQASIVSVFVDLQRQHLIEAVRVHSEGGGYGAVWHPETMSVFGSPDGAQWQLLKEGTPEKEITAALKYGAELCELAWLKLSFAPAAVRFVKIIMRPKAWLMLSEIEILSEGHNVARNCPYTLVPPPSSTAKYADRVGQLTDGDYSRPSDGWTKAVGWNEGQPQIVLDLLQPMPVDFVRVHCIGGGYGAVYFPQRIIVSLSLDGQSWSDAAETSLPPAEPGQKIMTAFLTARLGGKKARFVRIDVVERRGWTMLDEIEVLSGR